MLDHPTILTWLNSRGLTTSSLTDLEGDVSLRRYLRAEIGDQSVIVAVYPPEIRSTCDRFVETTILLTDAGVRVPRIIAHDADLGLMAVEDVGSATLYDLRDLDRGALDNYFRQAASNLKRIQRLPMQRVALLNPPLDAQLLRRELNQTWESLLVPRGITDERGFAAALGTSLTELCERLGSESPVPCHRDYMVRNLIPVDPPPLLAVIDHQDLRLGPRYYDLASLLNDSLFPRSEIEEEVLGRQLGTHSADRVHYHRAAAQRTLKAVGTYETFALRGFERHRKLIAPTLNRALHHLRLLPETAKVIDDLERHLRAERIC